MSEAPQAVPAGAWTAGALDPLAAAGASARSAAQVENRRLWRDVALVAALALAIRLLQVDRPPQFDELYHVLAARSWAHDGTLTVGSGAYTRAAGFTVLIGLFFKLLGDSLVAARLPSIIAGTLWVAAVHRWTGRRAGRLAGGLAGVLFGLDPSSIYLSEFARFYALQALLVWLGATALYDLVEERQTGWTAGRSVAVIAVTWLAAVYLQVTTLIALVAVGLWAAWRLGGRLLVAARQDPRARRLLVALAVLLVLGVAAMAAKGLFGRLYAQYRETPIWGEPTMNDWRYYERWFLGRYPLLWLLLPFAAAAALMSRRRAAAFALAVFSVSFALVSGAALKTERYMSFALPFFFVIWGMALATWAPGIARFAGRIATGLASAGWSPRVRTAAGWLVVAGFAGWIVWHEPAFAMTGEMARRDWKAKAYEESDWARAAPELRRLADSADVVISTALPKTLYYVGRGDVTLSLTELGELGRKNGKPIEFAVDERTGHPAISSPESVERIMACYRRGLVLIEDLHWHNVVVLPDSTRAFLAAHTDEIPLTPAWLVHARRWSNPQAPSAAGCPPWRTRASSHPKAAE